MGNNLFKSKNGLIALAFLFVGCSVDTSEQYVPEKNTWPYAVHYQVFVPSFYDSNGDGMGDINGLTAKLGYLQDLGVQGLWLMPVSPSPTYHKYHVTDYKGIDPEFGTVDDFKNFMAEAHSKGIKVIIDFVINHSDESHPWFLESKKGPYLVDTNSDSVVNPYWDYYEWKTDNEIKESKVIFSGEDTDNTERWHEVEGLDKKYYAYFNSMIPDLNFDNAEVKREMFEIGQWWLTEMNVDGFRLDAAKHIFDGFPEKNHSFWIEFREAMTEVKPDVLLAGEVWDKAEVVAPYLKGLPASFNFDLGYAIVNAVNHGVDSTLISTIISIRNYYQTVTSEFIDGIFIRNHDQNRIMNEVSYDGGKARVIASILLTLPGAPFLYYGEEIGMKGEYPDEYRREPFIWDYDGMDSGQPTWEEPRYSNSKTVTPLSAQHKNKGSIYHHYRDLIHTRNRSEVLTFGEISESTVDVDGIISFYRTYAHQKLFVIHNISPTGRILELPEDLSGELVFVADTDSRLEGRELSLRPYSSAIIQ